MLSLRSKPLDGIVNVGFYSGSEAGGAARKSASPSKTPIFEGQFSYL